MQHAPCLHCVAACVFVAAFPGPYGRKRDNYAFFAIAIGKRDQCWLQTCVSPQSQRQRWGKQDGEKRAGACENLWEVLAWEMQIAIAELSERTISMALIRQARLELISKWASPPSPWIPHHSPLYSPTATRCHNRLTKKCTAYMQNGNKKEPRPLFQEPQTTWLNDVNFSKIEYSQRKKGCSQANLSRGKVGTSLAQNPNLES